MKIGGIIRNDFSAAPGVCVTVFVQGCPLRCPGCHNPELQDFEGGRDLTNDEMSKIRGALVDNNVIRSLCIMGGEPLCKENLHTTGYLINNIHACFPDVKIYVWTGYTYAQLHDMLDELPLPEREWLAYILNVANYLVDGPFKQEERDITLFMRGSRNQRVIDLKTKKDVTDDLETRSRRTS